jgi:hypothetical protein
VEVGDADGVVRMRRSEEPEIQIVVSREAFAKLLSGVKAGEFDRPVEEGK